jgi:putative CocE/NonD family hydrolase
VRHPVRRIDHVPLVMDDGVVLSAAVFLPDVPGRFAAVIDAVPYRKDDDFLAGDWDVYGDLASRGFACVRIDLRGSGSSTGILENEYLAREQDDLVQAIALVARQPWCTGRVGMTGVSWGGFNAVQVAMRRPPELHAIVPIHFTTDRYHSDVHYVGGTLQVQESAGWPGEMVAEMGLPPRPDLAGADWVDVWRDRLERTPQWPLLKLPHPHRDAYWRHGSWCEDWAAITCPVLAIGGWIDTYQDACLALLEHAPAPSRAIIGPWGHTRPHVAWPGPAIDHRELMARWFDRFLNDVDNGVDREPRLVAYLRDGVTADPYPDVAPGRWHAYRAWPSAAPPTVLHLAGRALTATAPGEPRARTWDGPQWVGHAAPWWGAGSPPVGQSADMREDDRESLCFDTPPLDQPLAILGFPELELEVSSDRPVALVAARLEHVHPDRWSALVCRGGLNLTHRDSHAEPTLLEPGRRYRVRVPLVSTGTVIPAGHSLRLALAGAHWPVMWPPPQPAKVTVHGGTLTLPAPDAASEVPVPALPEPGARAPNPVRSLDGPPHAWTTTRDHGARRTEHRSTGGWESVWSGGRTFGSHDTRCLIDDDDPASCRVVTENVAECEHPGVRARCEGRLEQWCDEDAIHIAISQRVFRDGEPFFERDWRASFPRDLF